MLIVWYMCVIIRVKESKLIDRQLTHFHFTKSAPLCKTLGHLSVLGLRHKYVLALKECKCLLPSGNYWSKIWTFLCHYCDNLASWIHLHRKVPCSQGVSLSFFPFYTHLYKYSPALFDLMGDLCYSQSNELIPPAVNRHVCVHLHFSLFSQRLHLVSESTASPSHT